jgi:hypothetical protein
MKIKNKVIATVLGVLASSLFFIVAPTTANAGECSAADPCGTWAVIVNGTVVNTIVCQPSVCGSGTFNGQKVVFQVPANPVTHQYQYGHHETAHDQVVTYNEEQKTFSQQQKLYSNNEVVGSEIVTWSAPQDNRAVVETTTATGAVETTTLTAIINPDGSKQNNSATISATENNLVETKFFDQPKTNVEFESSIQNTVIMKKYLNKFLQLLRGWIIG